MNQAIDILCSDTYVSYIDEIYLYGSCSRGNQRYDSDVDLLVQYNESYTDAIGRQMRVAVLPEDSTLPDVELKFVQGDHWKTAIDPFSQNLRKDSILLWKRT
jgi:predicted nucleotidyltransferase